MARGNFRKKDMPGQARRHSAMSCAKMALAIDMPFGLSTQVGQRMHILGGVHTGASWRIPLNRSCAAAMRHSCQITLTTCYRYIKRQDVTVPVATKLSHIFCDKHDRTEDCLLLRRAGTLPGKSCTSWLDLYCTQFNNMNRAPSLSMSMSMSMSIAIFSVPQIVKRLQSPRKRVL